MVVLVVDAVGILAGKAESETPVAAHLHSPRALAGSLQFMQVHPRQPHIARVSRRVQSAQHQAEPVDVFRLDTALVAGDEERLEPLVPKALDRHSVQCNLCGYGAQSGEHPLAAVGGT